MTQTIDRPRPTAPVLARPSRSPRAAGAVGALVALALACVLALTSAAPAGAAYVFFEDDIVNAKTSQAELTGGWTLGGASGGLVRWTRDDGNGVKRGELKAPTYARARPGHNPYCIATQVRWQTVTGSPSFSLPAGASLTVGIQTLASGWKVSCRSRVSTTPPTPISLNEVAASSRLLLRVHVDICQMATASSLWACATDSNDYGGS